MFRKSSAKWEQLRLIQVDLIKNNVTQGQPVAEEDEDEVDDLAQEEVEAYQYKLKMVLRPKVDQATRWNSVAAMLMRLVQLRVPLDTWFVQNMAYIRPDDPKMLAPSQWKMIMDIVDVLGQLLPITKALESASDPGVVHVLPTLLNLLTRTLQRPADAAKYYSGRTREQVADSLGQDENTPSE